MINDNDLKGKILEELKFQTMWLRAIGLQAIKNSIEKKVETKEDKKIFELSDGARSLRDIAKAAGTSYKTVQARWKSWAADGLVVPSDRFKGRFKKIVS